MKRQQKMTISDPLSTRGSKQQIKTISSIWKGKHTRFETSHSLSPERASSPKRYWKELYSSWKKDPELDMGHIIPCDHQDFQTYKELADFSIQHHNNQNESSYEFVGVKNAHMDASVSGTLYIFLSIFAEIPKILDLDILGSKLEVCLQTGEKKVVFCTPCLDLPVGSMPKPTHKRFPPSKKTPTPTLHRQLFQKYVSAVTSRQNPGHSLEVPKAHPKYSAIKELAELAIADYNKRHDEANFEFVGLTHWSAGGTCPRSIYLFIEFVAKDCKSDLKGPAGILTFDCEVDIPFSTGTEKIVFCAQSGSNLRN